MEVESSGKALEITYFRNNKHPELVALQKEKDENHKIFQEIYNLQQEKLDKHHELYLEMRNIMNKYGHSSEDVDRVDSFSDSELPKEIKEKVKKMIEESKSIEKEEDELDAKSKKIGIRGQEIRNILEEDFNKCRDMANSVLEKNEGKKVHSIIQVYEATEEEKGFFSSIRRSARSAVNSTVDRISTGLNSFRDWLNRD